MTKVTIYKNVKNECVGFRAFGHAGYAEEGEDIICSAVSVLALNTVNSIEALTEVTPKCSMKDGYLSCEISVLRKGEKKYPDVVLLLDSLALGLKAIAETYGTQYLHVLTIQK